MTVDTIIAILTTPIDTTELTERVAKIEATLADIHNALTDIDNID